MWVWVWRWLVTGTLVEFANYQDMNSHDWDYYGMCWVQTD